MWEALSGRRLKAQGMTIRPSSVLLLQRRLPVMGFNLYSSNRSEILVEELTRVVASPPLPPLEREIIVVQSQGMERWLSQQLANRLGVWANGWFPFPNFMVRQLFQIVLKEVPSEDAFAPELMSWKLLSVLPTCLEQSEFATLERYLASGNRDLKLAQLCRRIADTFDQYTLYRPEMVLRWEQGQDSHWQAQLWRKLVAESAGVHRAALRQRFFEGLRKARLDVSGLPRRISIFGIPSLPPFHVEVFAAMSRFIEVHLFLMNPSQEFWADIVSEKELARQRLRNRQYLLPFPEELLASAGTSAGGEEKAASPRRGPTELHFEVGHPLLASLGKLGREFSGILLDQEECEERDHYEDPAKGTLLTWLQSDILKLHNRGKSGTRKAIATSDDSLQIHSCHSPMREIEVLHDRILALFDRHADLRPNDILVMTPDIETYAPYITAVFGTEREGQQPIPYAVSDRSAAAESPVVQGFFKILGLKGSRLGVSAVMDLFDLPIVQRRFGIQPDDRDEVLEWVKATRIGWGIDGEDRRQWEVPAFEENSWRAGLNRLLLGYALPSVDEQTFAGIVPFDAVEGSSSQLLGSFLEFVERLFERARSLEYPRSLAAWSEYLLALVADFFAEYDEVAREFQIVRRHLKLLADIQQKTGCDQPLALEAVRYFLEGQLQITELGRPFLTGGVTFCVMLPMRSIPFRVIAIVGMDSQVFPRRNRPPGFDLIASQPRPGDRSLRAEDRYLFLEALLSARDYLHISYVGQSIRDNSVIPPSVLVSELVDVIEQGFVSEDGEGPIQEQLCVRHRLQAFSPAYFSGAPRLYSYSQENFAALKSREGAPWTTKAFVDGSLGEPPAELRRIETGDLKRFYRNPAKFLLLRRLGIRLEEDAGLLEDREPFELDALDAYALKQQLVARRLAGHEPFASYGHARGQGILPAGKAGELLFRKTVAEVEGFLAAVKPLLAGQPLLPIDIAVDLGEFHLFGRIGDIWPAHMLRYRCASAKAKDHIDLWIDHLLLQSVRPDGYPAQSVLVAEDGAWEFRPVAESRSVLESLLRAYWLGLSEPLHFFPESAREYVRRRREGRSPDEALACADKTWRTTEWSRGESDNVYYEVAFGNLNPLDENFARLALEVFAPLLEHQTRLTT